jgi:RimJ/RimL family protein N-acetyltransferase
MSVIVGEGLALRLPQESDRERWLELLHDREQLRFGMPAVIPLPETVEDLDRRIADAVRRFADEEPTSFVIVDEHDQERFLGTIGWSFHVPPPLRVGDVGYGVHPDARGQGVATRSLRTLTRWLTVDDDGPRLARVQLDHSTEHPASCRVALAAGYEKEGVRRAFLPLRDDSVAGGVRRHDVCLHGLVPPA